MKRTKNNKDAFNFILSLIKHYKVKFITSFSTTQKGSSPF